MAHNTDNVRIVSSAPMVSPNYLIHKLPLSEKVASSVVTSRNTIKNILYGDDNRLMVLVGPCSIHDTKAAIEYANKLCQLKEELAEDLFIVGAMNARTHAVKVDRADDHQIHLMVLCQQHCSTDAGCHADRCDR